MTKIFKLVYPLPLKTTAINNLIRKYSFMRSNLNIIPFIFYAFLMLTSQYFILNLLLKCRIHSDFQGSLLCNHLVGSV